MTLKEIGSVIVAGLAAALAIVILGVLDALPLGVFIAVLFVGGLAGAAGAAYFGGRGAPPPPIERSSLDVDDARLKKGRPPAPPEFEEAKPEDDVGGAAAV